MRGFGTNRQPPGTWSDDGALILCTVDSLTKHEFDTADMAQRFVEWMYKGLWTAYGEPFDVGVATSTALVEIANGRPAEQAGGRDEYSNGNGALMRILPIVLRFSGESLEVFSTRIEKVCSITHRHPRSSMACVFYGLFIHQLLLNRSPWAALDVARVVFTGWYERSPEFLHFRPVLEDDFAALSEAGIVSTGYVLHTLHASLWCLLTTENFKDSVLKAVNLGGDTDTTGSVTGGLAGVAYGMKSIPNDWIQAIPRHDDLNSLFKKFIRLDS